MGAVIVLLLLLLLLLLLGTVVSVERMRLWGELVWMMCLFWLLLAFAIVFVVIVIVTYVAVAVAVPPFIAAVLAVILI